MLAIKIKYYMKAKQTADCLVLNSLKRDETTAW
jgi:hypothetical protein